MLNRDYHEYHFRMCHQPGSFILPNECLVLCLRVLKQFSQKSKSSQFLHLNLAPLIGNIWHPSHLKIKHQLLHYMTKTLRCAYNQVLMCEYRSHIAAYSVHTNWKNMSSTQKWLRWKCVKWNIPDSRMNTGHQLHFRQQTSPMGLLREVYYYILSIGTES